MRVFLQGNYCCKNFESKHYYGGGVVLVLLSHVCIHPESFACITDVDVFNYLFVVDGNYGGACIQYDPIWVYYFILWRAVHSLFHGESHLQWLWLHACTRCGGRSVSRIVSHFLAAVACDVCKWSLVNTWYFLAACVFMLYKCHLLRWCVCLVWWCRLLVTTQYVICGGWCIWVLFCNQKGIVLQIVPYTWE